MKTEKLVSELSGEVAVLTPSEAEPYEVPFAAGFDFDALKSVDEDPFFATIRIQGGRGDQGAGAVYDDTILQSIESQINEKRPPGYKGHQDPEKTDWEYREPVTAWVGAKFVPGADGHGELIVKGYVPTTAPDLRTQLQLAESGADVVNSVSIFGVREIENDQVKSFDLWSLDWTPKGRAGMQTELLAVSGEQKAKEDDDMALTREEVIASLKPEEVPEHLVEGIRKSALEGVSGKAALADEIGKLLGLDEDESAELVEKVKELVVSRETADLDAKLDEVLEDKVKAEMARAAVKDAILPKLKSTSTDEEIAGEISEALKRPYIEALGTGSVLPVFSGGAGNDEGREATVWE
jgi:hypothetical protein